MCQSNGSAETDSDNKQVEVIKVTDNYSKVTILRVKLQ